MSEDRLLRELGHLAQEEEGAERARLDERWDRLAAGTLTAEEEAELRALAETSPEAREAWEAFRPLGPEFQARVVEKISAELPPKEWWGRLLSFRPTPRFAGWATAAAAAVLAVFLRPGAPIPVYQIASISGGSSEMRGEQAEDFAPGDPIEVRLRPAKESRPGRLDGQLFLLRSGESRRLKTQIEFYPGGAAEMKASLDPDLQRGAWTLWAVVGRRGDLPDPAELQSLAAQGEVQREDWIAVSTDIRIRPRGP
ncbi:MAG TPA: hypothetical protein VNM67_14210 [Thermoanaerobaculia bacterium]|jgi:hypothetical protein|nr:hypothetical protein [Thermoanaerobaculia bacterium]